MTGHDETPLEKGERHVAEAEMRIARQNQIIAELDRDDHPHAAARARRVLAVMEQTLQVLRQHLKILRGG